MKWEYAALEVFGQKANAMRRGGWVLRKTRMGGHPCEHHRPNEMTDVLYRVDDMNGSLDLVNMAAEDGWEMTGQLPVGFNTEYGRYVTCPMMRRRIE
tara:strand:- start:139 stop:429 length:291 start_codon:yes stop_codon:yes gene_type:complete